MNDDTFVDFVAQEQQLFEQFAACPIVEMTGIVAVRGVCGVGGIGSVPWTLLMTFDAWRVGSGDLRTDPITVRRKVTEEELYTFGKRIDSETVIKIHARVAYENVFGSPQALIEDFIEHDSSDTELHLYLAELQKTVTYEDDFFGNFTFDRGPGCYTANVDWNGESISLHLSVEQADKIDAPLGFARELWNNQSTWNQRVQDFAVQELLSLKNEGWLDEDETELTPEQFKLKMKLEEIEVRPDGAFRFWHDDGNLFYGHSIEVSGSVSVGLTYIDICG